MRVRIGTRGSALARVQAEGVAAQLRALGAEVEVEILRTTGDMTPGFLPEAGVGAFVREIEQALLREEISLAVHSLKDLPVEDRPGLAVAAVPAREDPREALISASGAILSDLPAGSRVATGSPRRIAQIRAFRENLQFVPVRGNVDTRLRKLDEGQFDGLLLACAGLERLGLGARITQRIPTEVCLPAPGQGALALQIRREDRDMRAFVAQLDHLPTRQAVAAERAFLAALTGGCIVPVGALAEVEGGRLHLTGMVAHLSGAPLYRAEEVGSAEAPEAVGRTLAARVADMGGARILEEYR